MSINISPSALALFNAANVARAEGNRAMERIATGKQINSAQDAPVGIAISGRLDFEIAGIQQAVKNSIDAEGFLGVADASMGSAIDILQRMRELTVQSANDTLNASDRASIMLEINALIEEIDRIAVSTTVADQQLLNGGGSLSTANKDYGNTKNFTFQVGSTNSGLEEIKISMHPIGSEALGLQNFPTPIEYPLIENGMTGNRAAAIDINSETGVVSFDTTIGGAGVYSLIVDGTQVDIDFVTGKWTEPLPQIGGEPQPVELGEGTNVTLNNTVYSLLTKNIPLGGEPQPIEIDSLTDGLTVTKNIFTLPTTFVTTGGDPQPVEVTASSSNNALQLNGSTFSLKTELITTPGAPRDVKASNGSGLTIAGNLLTLDTTIVTRGGEPRPPTLSVSDANSALNYSASEPNVLTLRTVNVQTGNVVQPVLVEATDTTTTVNGNKITLPTTPYSLGGKFQAPSLIQGDNTEVSASEISFKTETLSEGGEPRDILISNANGGTISGPTVSLNTETRVRGGEVRVATVESNNTDVTVETGSSGSAAVFKVATEQQQLGNEPRPVQIMSGNQVSASANILSVVPGTQIIYQTHGFSILGGSVGDNAGTSVSSAGDFNGDGIDDVIVGVTGDDFAGKAGAGAAYIVYGRADGANINLRDIESGSNPALGILLEGETPIYGLPNTGYSVAGGGDINNDGYDDVIIGSPNYGINVSTVNSGKIHVVYGGQGLGNLQLANVGTTVAGFTMTGLGQSNNASDQLGWAISTGGDVNGDGYDDFVVSAPNRAEGTIGDAGAAYVVFGKAGNAPVDISLIDSGLSNEGFKITDNSSNSYIGIDVTILDDVNGDGLADIGVSSWKSSTPAGFVVFGKKDGDTVFTNQIYNEQSSHGYAIRGPSTSRLGTAIQNAGDMNGDGKGDLVIRDNTGNAFVVFGKSSTKAIDTVNITNEVLQDGKSLGFQISNIGVNGRAAGIGDVNGDGFDDIAVSQLIAPSRGQVDVVFGKETNTNVNLSDISNGVGGFRISTSNSTELGASVLTRESRTLGAAGDVNNDGYDDFIIGDPKRTAPTTVQGAAYVVYGGEGLKDIVISDIEKGVSRELLKPLALGQDVSFKVGGKTLTLDLSSLYSRGTNDLASAAQAIADAINRDVDLQALGYNAVPASTQQIAAGTHAIGDVVITRSNSPTYYADIVKGSTASISIGDHAVSDIDISSFGTNVNGAAQAVANAINNVQAIRTDGYSATAVGGNIVVSRSNAPYEYIEVPASGSISFDFQDANNSVAITRSFDISQFNITQQDALSDWAAASAQSKNAAEFVAGEINNDTQITNLGYTATALNGSIVLSRSNAPIINYEAAVADTASVVVNGKTFTVEISNERRGLSDAATELAAKINAHAAATLDWDHSAEVVGNDILISRPRTPIVNVNVPNADTVNLRFKDKDNSSDISLDVDISSFRMTETEANADIDAARLRLGEAAQAVANAINAASGVGSTHALSGLGYMAKVSNGEVFITRANTPTLERLALVNSTAFGNITTNDGISHEINVDLSNYVSTTGNVDDDFDGAVGAVEKSINDALGANGFVAIASNGKIIVSRSNTPVETLVVPIQSSLGVTFDAEDGSSIDLSIDISDFYTEQAGAAAEWDLAQTYLEKAAHAVADKINADSTLQGLGYFASTASGSIVIARSNAAPTHERRFVSNTATGTIDGKDFSIDVSSYQDSLGDADVSAAASAVFGAISALEGLDQSYNVTAVSGDVVISRDRTPRVTEEVFSLDSATLNIGGITIDVELAEFSGEKSAAADAVAAAINANIEIQDLGYNATSSSGNVIISRAPTPIIPTDVPIDASVPLIFDLSGKKFEVNISDLSEDINGATQRAAALINAAKDDAASPLFGLGYTATAIGSDILIERLDTPITQESVASVFMDDGYADTADGLVLQFKDAIEALGVSGLNVAIQGDNTDPLLSFSKGGDRISILGDASDNLTLNTINGSISILQPIGKTDYISIEVDGHRIVIDPAQFSSHFGEIVQVEMSKNMNVTNSVRLSQNALAGSTILLLDSVEGLSIGDQLIGSGLATDTHIQSIDSGNSSVVISKAVSNDGIARGNLLLNSSFELKLNSVDGLLVGDIINHAALPSNTKIIEINKQTNTVRLDKGTLLPIDGSVNTKVSIDKSPTLIARQLKNAIDRSVPYVHAFIDDNDASVIYVRTRPQFEITDNKSAALFLDIIDAGLQKLNTQRSEVGVAINTIVTNIELLSNVDVNLQIANGTIVDADYAAEMTRLAIAKLLEEVAISMIAQANASRKSVLTLLRD